MAIEIPSSFVEFILLGPADDRRQLQDSPILGDVWIAYGKAPAKPQELLISPYKTRQAGYVAATIAKGLSKDDKDDAHIAYLQGLVVADLKFIDVLRLIIPKTAWWIDRWEPQLPPRPKKGRGKSAVRAPEAANSAPGVELVMSTGEKRRFVHETDRYFGSDEKTHISTIMKKIIRSAEPWNNKIGERVKLDDITPLDRFAALTGLILWAGQEGIKAPADASDAKNLITFILKKLDEERQIVSDLLATLCAEMLADDHWKEVKKGDVPLVWSVSCNRSALPAIAKSVPAVKADAATTLFKVNCSEIAWAVLDSGIDGSHVAFSRADERAIGSSKRSTSGTSAAS